MDDLIARNLDRLYESQADRLQKQLAPLNPTENAAYLGFDDGVHQARAVDGSIVRGQMTTNGGVAIGSGVSVYTPEGGTAFMDGMPR